VSVVAVQTVTFARKTEVAVRKGEVLAETAAASVAIGAGRKAVLETDRKPKVSVDNPLVDDALELYKLIEAEKENSDLKIDSAFILVGKADKDEIVGALFFEVPNYRPAATNVLTLPSVSIIEDFKVYDMSGNLCRVDMKRLDESTASYSIHFSQTLQPRERFRFFGVANLQDVPALPGGGPTYWKEGPLWYFRTINGASNCLNYFRLVFPSSAILVDTNREIVATDTVDGKLAVTMRNYTGPYADGLCIVSFLWPDEDGTTLADIPDKYHGLRSKRDRQNTETFRREMHKIRAGIRYTDQSTPLAALLTGYGSAIQEDTELYDTAKYTYQAPDSIQKWVKNAKYFADRLDFLSMPQWPDNPGNGYVHPIYMSRKGSLIDEFIMPMVYEDGRWYAHNTKGKPTVDYEKATPEDIATAKRKGYICDWEVAGPYIQKGEDYEDLHDIPFGPELPDADVTWLPATIISDDKHPVLVNIDKSIMHFNDSVAYLRTEITSETQRPVRLEIYTDDGVKAWLNGELIFENNVGRGIPDQPDTVNVTLKKGVNHLQLKVTEAIWGSRAMVRIGSDKAAGPQPTDKAIHPKTQVKLDWTPAATGQSHRVYLGTDENDLSLLAEVSEPQQLKTLSLEADRRYYWRVDEVLADGSKVEGDVWSFATSQQVAFWTFDGHAKDRSLQAFHGTIHGNPRWVPGVSNQAVALDCEEDYIIIPPMNLNTDTMTITLWVRTEEIIENPGLVFTRGGSTGAGLWLNMNNNLRYNWNNDQQTWLWDSGFFVPNKTWTFAALVVDPEKASIYMHDGTAMKSATHTHAHGGAEFDRVTYIGHDPRWSTVKGAIDEVRIYNYALDAKEIEAIYLEAAKKP
jgi:hypothetical protein